MSIPIGPDSFDRVAVHFPQAVSVRVASPLPLRVVDRLAAAPCLFDPAVGTGSVGVEHRDRFGVGFDLRSDSRLLGVGADDQPKRSAGLVHQPERRRTVVFVGAPAALFVGPSAGWVAGIKM